MIDPAIPVSDDTLPVSVSELAHLIVCGFAADLASRVVGVVWLGGYGR